MTNNEQSHDWVYFDLVRQVLNGNEKSDRTGTGTISAPFVNMKFDISDQTIPLLTTKKMFTKGIIHELFWFIAGDTNIQYLNDQDVHIWDQWADSHGDLGPVYGAQWRRCMGVDRHGNRDTVDQLADVINRLRTNPTDRRIIIDSWNVTQLGDMALPPCHCLIQFWSDGEQLQVHLYQRSADVGLGVPFNIAQYSIFAHMVAQVTGLKATYFHWTGGDVHIYKNHVSSLITQLSRDPYQSPKLQLNTSISEIDCFTYQDISIQSYKHHDPIKMEVSV